MDASNRVFRCSYCNGDCKEFTGQVYHSHITTLIPQLFQKKQQLTGTELKKAVKDRKALIWHRDDLPKSSMKQIHALLLQLVAREILRPNVSDS